MIDAFRKAASKKTAREFGVSHIADCCGTGLSDWDTSAHPFLIAPKIATVLPDRGVRSLPVCKILSLRRCGQPRIAEHLAQEDPGNADWQRGHGLGGLAGAPFLALLKELR
jgi:hypothetical protein